MQVLVMNCSPVRNGATAEIVNIISKCLKERYDVKSICIDDFVFIDRCTPWCNTHEPHATLSTGKKGYVVALRTGTNMRECQRIFESIEHFYGHLEIECCDRFGLCSVECKNTVEQRKEEIIEFCNRI